VHRYTQLWWAGVVAVTVGGVLMALALPAGVLAVVALGGGLLGGAWIFFGAQHVGPQGSLRRRYLRAGAAAGAGAVALAGLLAQWRVGGAALGGLLVALSPAALGWSARIGRHGRKAWPRRLSGRRRSMTMSPEPPAQPSGPESWVPTYLGGPPVQALTDAQLCQAWQASYPVVKAAAQPRELSAVAMARGAYLDELQRRHPADFERWMTSGAHAASDLSRWMCPDG
jgi:hypothetical protein